MQQSTSDGVYHDGLGLMKRARRLADGDQNQKENKVRNERIDDGQQRHEKEHEKKNLRQFDHYDVPQQLADHETEQQCN